jgi:DNA recombination protein RmuC
MEFLIALLALAAGLPLGWLLARQRAEAALRAALAETAALRAGLDAERAATAQREQLLMGHGNLAALVSPMRDALARVQQQLDEVRQGRAMSDSTLREQVRAMSATSEQLRTETAQLVTALRAPQVRGRWGEMQLERVVEAAGMTQHVDFTAQQPLRDTDGRLQRPDLVVHLTGGKQVVVDAKAPFNAYLEAMQAGDEATRDARFAAHARALRTHVTLLSAKAYWERCTPTPEFVVCFVPADAFLDAALQHDTGLQEFAFAHNVVLATPATLVALLRTVAYTWRQQALAANAEQVHDLGRELYERLGTMTRHVERLGKNLGAAVGAYNDAVGSFERRVLTKARQFRELGVAPESAPLPDLDPLIDAVPRSISQGAGGARSASAEGGAPRVVRLRDGEGGGVATPRSGWPGHGATGGAT